MAAETKTGAAGAAGDAGTKPDAVDLAGAAAVAQAKHATLRYATLRIAIFLVALGVLWGAVEVTGRKVTGNGALYLCMGALLVSGIVSFFLLNRQRDAMSAQVTARAERITRRVQENASMEDED